MAKDNVRYYGLEQYLFTTVHERFHRERELGAFDLMSIVIWKANRRSQTKSKVAKRLLTKAERGEDLDRVARRLTSTLYRCSNDPARLTTL